MSGPTSRDTPVHFPANSSERKPGTSGIRSGGRGRPRLILQARQPPTAEEGPLDRITPDQARAETRAACAVGDRSKPWGSRRPHPAALTHPKNPQSCPPSRPRLPDYCCPLLASRCLLPAACSLLPAACRLPPAACCLQSLVKPGGRALMSFEQRRSSVDHFFGSPRFGHAGAAEVATANSSGGGGGGDDLKFKGSDGWEPGQEVRIGESCVGAALGEAASAANVRLFRIVRHDRRGSGDAGT